MKQSGNALFLILIAVALFAALSYAVTQSGRGGGSIDREQAQIRAAELVQVIGNVRNAVMKLKLLNGCADEEISSYSDLYSTPSTFDNSNSPVAGGDFTCHIHHPDGGNVLYFGEDKGEPICGADCGNYVMLMSGRHAVQGLGTANVDLMYMIDGVNEEFCNAFNRYVGIDAASVPTDSTSIAGADAWQGTFADGSPRVIGDGDAIFVGQDMGCFDSSSSNGNAIFAVIITR